MPEQQRACSVSRRRAIAASAAAVIGLGVVGAQIASPQPGGEGDSASADESASPDGDTLEGKTALVTGSTDGLGREVAMQLASLGATVIVHGRNRERGAAVVGDIEAAGGHAVFYPADLASLDEVRDLADSVIENHDGLDILINNAGIWAEAGSDTRRTSDDGHELVFAVNYLAGFVLTHRLLPLLERSAPARIINVSSLAQQPIDFADVMLTRNFSSSRAYAQSKLAQVMFTFDLAEELAGKGIAVNSLHPATLMDTAMVEKAGVTPRSTVQEGAHAVMQLAASEELEGRTGLYFNRLQQTRANAQAYDEEARAKLRTLSVELTGAG
jgi:NAD(P)-dependent dehydrogenase (short-subunit alcohol dehydrogenase family)